MVGTSDLGAAIVLAANLAPGSVTADKAALDIGGDNLMANNSFEVDANADGIADGWAGYNNSPGPEPSTLTRQAGRISGYCQRNTWTGTNTTTKGVVADNASGGGVRGGWQTSKTYVVSWYARADTAKASGMGLGWNTAPATSVSLKNPNLATTWQRYAQRITTGGTVEASGRLYITIIGALTGYVEIDDVQVEEGDTLSGYQGKLALNTIVAGDGAIANLAVMNAQIGALAVDDGKVANLSASKLSVGTGIIGGDLKSSNYAFGASGWIVRPSGYAEFDFTMVRGSLQAGQISAGYISAAMITAGTITANEIIANGITAPGGGFLAANTPLVATGWTTLVQTTINPNGSPAFITAIVQIKAVTAITSNNLYLAIYRDGTKIANSGSILNLNNMFNTESRVCPISWYDASPPAGSHTYSVMALVDLSGQVNAIAGSTNLFAIGFKR